MVFTHLSNCSEKQDLCSVTTENASSCSVRGCTGSCGHNSRKVNNDENNNKNELNGGLSAKTVKRKYVIWWQRSGPSWEVYPTTFPFIIYLIKHMKWEISLWFTRPPVVRWGKNKHSCVNLGTDYKLYEQIATSAHSLAICSLVLVNYAYDYC